MVLLRSSGSNSNRYFNLVGSQINQLRNVALAGMGGSALAGLLSNTWPDYSVPFEIVRDYEIPSYVGESTLFIASSYSGNTEETLAALAMAEKAKAQIIIMSSGGKLEEIAKEKGHPFELLPKASQPRFGVLYSLKAYVTILERAGLVKTDSAEAELHKTAEFLKKAVEDLAANSSD